MYQGAIGVGNSKHAEGSLTLTGTTEKVVTVGFEPKAIGIKRASNDELFIFWVSPSTVTARYLSNAWSTGANGGNYTVFNLTSTGFSIKGYPGATLDVKYEVMG